MSRDKLHRSLQVVFFSPCSAKTTKRVNQKGFNNMKHSIRILCALLVALLCFSTLSFAVVGAAESNIETQSDSETDSVPTTESNSEKSEIDFSTERLSKIIPKALEGYGVTILIMCIILICVVIINRVISRFSGTKNTDANHQE